MVRAHLTTANSKIKAKFEILDLIKEKKEKIKGKSKLHRICAMIECCLTQYVQRERDPVSEK